MRQLLRGIVTAVSALFAVAPTVVWADEAISVRSGVDTPILSHLSLRPDTCGAGVLPIVTVLRPPAHGTIHVEKVPMTVRGGNCAGRSVKGVRVYYRSTAGYRGSDSVRVEVQTNLYVNGVGTRGVTDDVSIVVR